MEVKSDRLLDTYCGVLEDTMTTDQERRKQDQQSQYDCERQVVDRLSSNGLDKEEEEEDSVDQWYFVDQITPRELTNLVWVLEMHNGGGSGGGRHGEPRKYVVSVVIRAALDCICESLEVWWTTQQ